MQNRHLYFYALISLSSLLVGVASRFSSSSSSLFLSFVCVCLRGLCARSFSSLFFLLLQCQHHERRPTDRQSTTTRFAQLKNRMAAVVKPAKVETTTTSTNFHSIFNII